MQTIKVKYSSEIPEKYTGIIEWVDGSVRYYYNGKSTTKEAIELLQGIMKLKATQEKIY